MSNETSNNIDSTQSNNKLLIAGLTMFGLIGSSVAYLTISANSELEIKLADANQTIKKLKTNEINLNNQINDLTQQKREMASSISKLESNSNLLNGKIKSFEQETENLNQTIIRLDKEKFGANQIIEQMKSNEIVLNSKINNLDQQKNELFSNISRLESNLTVLNDQVKSFEQENNFLSQTVMKLGKEKFDANQIIDQFKSNEIVLNTKMADLNQQKSDLTLTISSLESNVSLLNNQIKTQEQENNYLKQTIMKLDNEKLNANKIIEQLKTNETALNDKLVQQKNEMISMISQYEANSTSLKNQIQVLEFKHNELNRSFSKLSKENNYFSKILITKEKMNLSDANNFCRSENLVIPSFDELQMIYAQDLISPTLNKLGENNQSNYFWTNELQPNGSITVFNGESKFATESNSTTNKFFVTCVSETFKLIK